MRQLRVLDAIQLFGKLTRPQIEKWTDIRPEYLQDLLAELKRKGDIQVCPASRKHEKFLSRFRVYELTPQGEKRLLDAGLWRALPKDRTQFAHSFLTAEAHFSFRVAPKEVDGLRYISTEDILKNPRCPEQKEPPNCFTLRHGQLRPDLPVFGYELTENGRSAYLFGVGEIDRNTEQGKDNPNKHKTMESMILAYDEFFRSAVYKSKFGLTQCSAFFLFTNPVRLQHFKERVAVLSPGYAKYFNLTTIPDFYDGYAPANGYLATTQWERVGEPMQIVATLKAHLEKTREARRQSGASVRAG